MNQYPESQFLLDASFHSDDNFLKRKIMRSWKYSCPREHLIRPSIPFNDLTHPFYTLKWDNRFENVTSVGNTRFCCGHFVQHLSPNAYKQKSGLCNVCFNSNMMMRITTTEKLAAEVCTPSSDHIKTPALHAPTNNEIIFPILFWSSCHCIQGPCDSSSIFSVRTLQFNWQKTDLFLWLHRYE